MTSITSNLSMEFELFLICAIRTIFIIPKIVLFSINYTLVLLFEGPTYTVNSLYIELGYIEVTTYIEAKISP